jgi:hypothetical protein
MVYVIIHKASQHPSPSVCTPLLQQVSTATLAASPPWASLVWVMGVAMVMGGHGNSDGGAWQW